MDGIVTTGPFMGSEDFSLLAPPGCRLDYWQVASTTGEVWDGAPGGDDPFLKLRAVPANHSPLFAPDLAVVELGAHTLAAAEYLLPTQKGTTVGLR